MSKRDEAVFTMRIDRQKLARYREIAEADNRTVTQQLRKHIDDAIAQADERERTGT